MGNNSKYSTYLLRKRQKKDSGREERNNRSKPTTRSSVKSENSEPQQETLVWKPGMVSDEDLRHYLRAVRIIASETVPDQDDKQTCNAYGRTGDVMNSAFDTLHKADYDCEKAINMLKKSRDFDSFNNSWTLDDKYHFNKGTKVFGKHFRRIQRYYLPKKTMKEIVQYYYSLSQDVRETIKRK